MLKKILIALAVLVVAIQVVPYGRNHSNPPRVAEPAWDSPATRAQFIQVCGDCHSNETRWPWYSHLAPVSWMLQKHVDDGRGEFNVSRWDREENEGEEAAEMVRKRHMPLRSYTWAHPEARLTDDERTRLIAGLVATFGDEGLEGSAR